MNYTGIFQGGGVKGIAHIGALCALEERGFFCKRATGTSVGAIIASLLIVGYRAEEIRDILFQTDLLSLRSTSKHKKFQSIFTEAGIYHSTNLEGYLTMLYQKKGKLVYQDIKFGRDYLLKVVATDVIKRRKVVFPNDLLDYGILPDTFPIAKSVVMSSTYPGFYKPLKLKKSWIVDGGISSNFPTDTFVKKPGECYIGFQLMGEKEKPLLYSEDDIWMIRIPTSGIKAMQFKLNDMQKMQLFQAGYLAGKRFVEQFYQQQAL